MQFLMVAYNFLNSKAGYVNTGSWSTKAIKEAKMFGDVSEIASSADKNFNYIPNLSILMMILIMSTSHQIIQYLALNFIHSRNCLSFIC